MEIYIFVIVLHLLYKGVHATAKHDKRCQYRNGSLDCSERQLSSIDCHFPMDVQGIDLSIHNIVNIPAMCFKGLEYAKSISVTTNKITHIDQDAFFGLENLLTLKLFDNYIQEIPRGVFTPLISLRYLYLQQNMYSDNLSSFRSVLLELSPLQNLKSLRTDVNNKLNRSDWCPVSQSLESLLLIPGNGMNINTEIFKDVPNLKELIIYTVSGVEKYAFQHLFNLKSLTIILLGDNPNIESVFLSFGVFRGRNMSLLSVTGNNYLNDFHINRNHFIHIQNICLKQLILNNLFITYVEPRSFRLFAHKSRCLEILDVSQNPISTHENSWFFSLSVFAQLKVFRASHFKKYCCAGKSLYHVERVKHFNTLKISFPIKLEELHITYTYSKYDIPGSLIALNGGELKILDLAYVRVSACNGTFYGLPNLHRLDMSGWNCSVLSEMLLSHFPKLQTIIAKESFLGTGLKCNINSFKLFKENLELRYIDMSANGITKIPTGLLGSHLSHLQFLNLSSNILHDFPMFSSQMSKLKVVDLRSNNIATIPTNMQKILDIICPHHLFLSGNPFHCTCKNIEFLMWLNTTNILKAIDMQFMKCITETGLLTGMSTIVKDIADFTKRCESKTWIIIATTLSSMVLTVLILTIVFIRYKYAIEYMYIRIKMKLKKYKKLEENEYEFQAFVSHSHLDTEWVVELYNVLKNRGVEMCFDAKDFIAGNSVAENIAQAINTSRKVIFVITENFLKSTWGSYELEMARMHAFREDRDNMIIVIMKDEIPLHKMPKVLRDIWYKILCIKWHSQPTNEFETEDVFYNRLYEAVSL